VSLYVKSFGAAVRESTQDCNKELCRLFTNLKIMKQQISATKLYSLQKIALASIASTETIT